MFFLSDGSNQFCPEVLPRAARLLAVVMARSRDLQNSLSGPWGLLCEPGQSFSFPSLFCFPRKAPGAKPTPGDPCSCPFAKQCLIPHLTFSYICCEHFNFLSNPRAALHFHPYKHGSSQILQSKQGSTSHLPAPEPWGLPGPGGSETFVPAQLMVQDSLGTEGSGETLSGSRRCSGGGVVKGLIPSR